MPPDDRGGQAKDLAQGTYFILEEVTQRFDEFEPEFLGEPADVVMQLDVGGSAGQRLPAFDDVGVEGALREKTNTAIDLLGGLLEDLDETMSDQTSFLLGVRHSFKVAQEVLRRVDDAKVDVEMTAERPFHEFTFVLSQKTVVHEDAGELVTDRTREQCSHHRGINAAREAADDSTITDLRLHSGTFGFHEFAHLPTSRAPTDSKEEVSQNVDAVRRVGDFGVELHAIEREFMVPDRRVGTGVGVRECGERITQP